MGHVNQAGQLSECLELGCAVTLYVIVQDVTIGGNRAKGTWDRSVLFPTNAHEPMTEEGMPVTHRHLPVCIKFQLTSFLRQAMTFAFFGFLSV